MVEYILIEGKKYPVRIGYYVMKKVKEETGKSFSQSIREIQETEDMSIYEIILFYALKAGAAMEKVEMPFEREDMELILDAVFYDFLKVLNSPKFRPSDDLIKEEDKEEATLGKPNPPAKKVAKKTTKKS